MFLDIFFLVMYESPVKLDHSDPEVEPWKGGDSFIFYLFAHSHLVKFLFGVGGKEKYRDCGHCKW